MRIVCRRRWLLSVALALALAGLVTARPARPAGADSETFFNTGATTPAPCPIAHCDQQLDGRENLSIAASTPPLTSAIALYTPSPAAAFNNGLGCTTGEDAAATDPDLVTCALSNTAGNTSGPFLYSITATGSLSSTALSLNWASAPYTGTQPTTCTTGSSWAMDHYVEFGAPLSDDVGHTYVSDDHSLAKYTANGAGGVGTCAWGVANPASAAMISWNAVYLPPNGSGSNPFLGNWYLVGQGTAGPLVLEGHYAAQTQATLGLTDTTGYYVTYNTVSAVPTATGARVYDSTALCPTDGGCSPFARVSGRLYAIDVTSPITEGGTPTLSVAWHYDFRTPAGASPMVLPAASGAPVGDNIYFDGSPCTGLCLVPHPTLYALHDRCPFGSICSSDPYTPTVAFAVDFTTQFGSSEDGYCSVPGSPSVYRGIQAAPALEAPESSGSDLNDSVWAYVTCGSKLYRFDAQTGALWSGSGASSIDVSSFAGLSNYVPSSAMTTITDTNTGHQTMFVGAQLAPPTRFSYVLALDLETGGLFWKVLGPTSVGNNADTPFQGQFPIARTAAGGNVLIATTAGVVDGSSILGIPLW